MKWTKDYAVFCNDLSIFYSDRSFSKKAVAYAHKSLKYSKDYPLLRIFSLATIARLFIIEENDSLAKLYNEQIPPIIQKNDFQFLWDSYYNNAGAIEKDTLEKQKIFKKCIEF